MVISIYPTSYGCMVFGNNECLVNEESAKSRAGILVSDFKVISKNLAVQQYSPK